MKAPTAAPGRRGRPPRALQGAGGASQALPATHVAADASEGRTEALVSLDPATEMAQHIHNWLSSLSRGPRNVRD